MVKNVLDKLPVPTGCGHWPGHITTGIIGGKYLFQALADAGHKDVALHILETTDYPGECPYYHSCVTLYSHDAFLLDLCCPGFGFMFSNKMEPATGACRMLAK